MRVSIHSAIMRRALGIGMAPLTAVPLATPAVAQAQALSIPAQPLAGALRRIAAETGADVRYDPDAVGDATSAPVSDARTAEAAVAQAIRGTRMSMTVTDGRIEVTRDIVVTAIRDAAETGVLVNEATTSSRTGTALRDQPRNAQVISSRLIAEQQSQTLADALRNAGGVTVNTAAVQGGITYSVRGFSTSGMVNGLPSQFGGAAYAGASQPLANIERLEVLKGPDALLAGAENLGGVVNIVTKKPSAGFFLETTVEAGSFGQRRGTVDVNGAIDPGQKLSARLIVSGNDADRNQGGYRGNRDFLLAPSIRYKDAKTDVLLGATLGDQFFGTTPFTVRNPVTNRPFAYQPGRPIFRRSDQGIRTETMQVFGEATHDLTDWLTLVARGQHQEVDLNIGQYAPFGVYTNGSGALISNSRSRMKINIDAVDGYARIAVGTGPLSHGLVIGATYASSLSASFSSSTSTIGRYNFPTATTPPIPLAPIDRFDNRLTSTQAGIYGQYTLAFWKVSLMAGVRRNRYTNLLTLPTGPRPQETIHATTPNFGAVVKITDTLSVFGSLAYGYNPVNQVDWQRNPLPNIKTRNAEAGAKIDLFDDRLLVNASWFRLRQDNVLFADPAHPGFQIAGPGQQGTGIDLNATGQITPNWTAIGSFTRTKYEFLTFSPYGNTVQRVPRDQYSVYTSYRQPLDTDLTVGLGTGAFGRSSSAVTTTNSFRMPAAVQVDANVFVTWRRFDLNLGIRNVFDRLNYGVTSTTSYLPIGESRTWRATLTYRYR